MTISEDVLGLFSYFRNRRNQKRPLPQEWRGILEEWFPIYGRIPAPELERFHSHLKIFVWGKHWIPAGGLEEVSMEMRVVIAASAARIARNLPFGVYDRLSEIVVYPGSYQHPKREGEILGEAHHWGMVVLSWDDVSHGIKVPNDGHDTAVHEFAHVLDVGADGWFDGTPDLVDGADYSNWSRVMSDYYLRLNQKKLSRGVLREYGATNEAEFFAVATEAFFEKPTKLNRHAPELFEAFAKFYGVDPIKIRKKYK